MPVVLVSIRDLVRNRASTTPEHPDPTLRGRSYALPFRKTWRAAIGLADGGLSRWTVIAADQRAGQIRAEVKTPVLRFVDDVEIRIVRLTGRRTRVDLTSASRMGKVDFGTNARRVRAFLRALDRRLGTERPDLPE